MNWVGTAERIFAAPGAGVEMTERSEVEAVAGGGFGVTDIFGRSKRGPSSSGREMKSARMATI